MPDRIPPKTLGEHLDDVENKFDRLDDRQMWRNRALVVAIVVIAAGLAWVRQGQIDRDNATANRIQSSCAQQNRHDRDFLEDFARAVGQDPNDPAVQAGIDKFRRRDCSEEGTKAYFDNAPPSPECEGDGKGFCTQPTTTTTTP